MHGGPPRDASGQGFIDDDRTCLSVDSVFSLFEERGCETLFVLKISTVVSKESESERRSCRSGKRPSPIKTRSSTSDDDDVRDDDDDACLFSSEKVKEGSAAASADSLPFGGDGGLPLRGNKGTADFNVSTD